MSQESLSLHRQTREPAASNDRPTAVKTWTVLLIVVTSALAGCGHASVSGGSAAAPSYAGPLSVARDDARHADAGAAGDIVECDAYGAGGFSGTGVYGEGATADTADEALIVAADEWAFGGVHEGLRLAELEPDRALYVLEVHGVVKQAVIVRDGPATAGAGGRGWYVESWAHCDYSELPRSFTEGIGVHIWTDASGKPQATTLIESWTGPEHCNWQSMTFLQLAKAVYVRDPQPGLTDFFAEPYDEHASVPAGAIDTGYERDGHQLWLSADRQRAFVGTVGDVEMWPRTTRPLSCA